MADVREDQTNLSWKDPMWLQYFPLNAQTVLDYFALSIFYDRTCNNETCRMQRLELDKLKSMRGIEYILLYAQENNGMFVIRKQFRESPDRIFPLAAYYVIGGAVYQAPSAYAVISSRLQKSLYHINKSLSTITDNIKFVALTGHTWGYLEQESAQKEAKVIAPTTFDAAEKALKAAYQMLEDTP
eukprot:GILK01008750.1.p1 GENE.GILK01008750.1~~GILK01008750.1.p1  ORF type:complete len:198 (-),score=29.87 GILK01008750.1:375-929(-)